MRHAPIARPRRFRPNSTTGIGLFFAGLALFALATTWHFHLPPYYRTEVRIVLELPASALKRISEQPAGDERDWDPYAFQRGMAKFTSEPLLQAALAEGSQSNHLDGATSELRPRYFVRQTRGTSLVLLRLSGRDPQNDRRILSAIARAATNPIVWAAAEDKLDAGSAGQKRIQFQPSVIEEPYSDQVVHPQADWAIGFEWSGVVLTLCGVVMRLRCKPVEGTMPEASATRLENPGSENSVP